MNSIAIDTPIQARNGLAVDPRSFLFTLVNGSGASGSLSSAGAKSVTLTPVPVGVNGSDVGHWVRISGGTGTAEAVLITGGTAVSGAASGSITFVSANAHSGAWQVESATAGIQEAVSFIGTSARATIVIPGGPPFSYIYGPINIASSLIDLMGLGNNASILRMNVTTGDVITIDTPVQGVFSMSNVRFLEDVPNTTGAWLRVKNCDNPRLQQVRMSATASYVGIRMDSCNDPHFVDVQAVGFSLHGIWHLSGAQSIGGMFLNIGCGGGTDLVNFTGFLVQADTGGNIAGLQICNLTCQTGAYGLGLFANGGSMNEVEAQNLILDGLSVRCINLAIAGGGTGNGIILSGIRTGGVPSSQILNIPRGFQNVIVDKITGSTAGGTCIKILGAKNVTLSDLHLGGSGNPLDVSVEITDDGSGNPCDSIDILGSRLGYEESGGIVTNVAAYGIAVSAVAHTRISINGNSVYGTTKSLSHLATVATGNRIVGNLFEGIAPTISIQPASLSANVGLAAVSVASNTALAFPPVQDGQILTVTGNTAVTSVSGLKVDQFGWLLFTNAVPAQWTAGATIGNTFIPTQNILIPFAFDGTKIWTRA